METTDERDHPDNPDSLCDHYYEYDYTCENCGQPIKIKVHQHREGPIKPDTHEWHDFPGCPGSKWARHSPDMDVDVEWTRSESRFNPEPDGQGNWIKHVCRPSDLAAHKAKQELEWLFKKKHEHFRGLGWKALTDSDSSAYESTQGLPEDERREAINHAFWDYINNRLAPLVREAVPVALNLAKLANVTGVIQREKYIAKLVTEWIIDPAARSVESWFETAVDGPLRETPGQDRVLEPWMPPLWLHPERESISCKGDKYIYRCGKKSLEVTPEHAAELQQRIDADRPRQRLEYLDDHEYTLRLRLENGVLGDEVKARAEELLLPPDTTLYKHQEEPEAEHKQQPREKRKPGRPTNDPAHIARAIALHREGKTHDEISAILTNETGRNYSTPSISGMLKREKSKLSK